MKDGYNTEIDDNGTYRPEGWGIRDNKDAPLTRRAPEHAQDKAEDSSNTAPPPEQRVYETVASVVWQPRGEMVQRAPVAAPPREAVTNPFFPDLTLSLHDNDGTDKVLDKEGTGPLARLSALGRRVAAQKRRARIPALVLAVALLGALSIQFVASNFLHVHGFAQPTTIGTLSKQTSAIPLTLPKTSDVKKSFSAQYNGPGSQIQVFAQLGTGQSVWSPQDLQTIQTETGIIIDPTSTVQMTVSGASMSCSTAVAASGYESICFWTDYDVRSVVLDLTSSAPGDAAAWSVQVKQAIEG